MRREIVILCLAVGLISGCAYVPSTTIDYMDRWKDKLYILTGDPCIKIFDPKSNRLVKKSYIPGSDWRYIKKVFREDDHLIFQVSKSSMVIPTLETQLFLVDEQGEVKSSGLIIENAESLTGVDNNSYYFIRAYSPMRANEGFRYKGFRYDKQTKKRTDCHLEKSPELVVLNIWKDETHYWYVCLYDLRPDPFPVGKLALVSKSIEGSEYKQYFLDDGHFHNVHITGDRDFVWIFSSNGIIKFSKKKGTIEVRKKNTEWLFPVETYGSSDISDFLWGFKVRNGLFNEIYRIHKADLELQPLTMKDMKLPDDFSKKVRNFPYFKGICADEEYIWTGIPLKRSALHKNYIPYVLKSSKSDFSSELFTLQPTFGEAIRTVSMNFLADLATPIRALIFLIFGSPH